VRVFLDSNVLFSSAYAGPGAPTRLIDWAAARRFTLVVSRTVLDEVLRNLRKKAPAAMPRADRVLGRADLEIVHEASEQEIRRWYDAGLGSDALIVAAAEAAEVDYFCTGDRRLLQRAKGGKLERLRVVSPAELVRLLEAESGHGGSGVD
jgi:predicted nucleic acid-binding protein